MRGGWSNVRGALSITYAKPPKSIKMRTQNHVNEATEAPVREVERSRTGVAGLDSILRGGLPANRLYVIEGEPGSGKDRKSVV